MNVEFLNAKQVGDKVNELIESSDAFYCAVAWVTNTKFAQKLWQENYRKKIKQFIVGVDFARTSDTFLENFQNTDTVRYMPNNGGMTFHPKIYYFETGENATVIIGSSNCTDGGLIRNQEASFLMHGDKDNETIVAVRQQIEKWFEQGTQITPEFVANYQRIKEKFSTEQTNLNTELKTAVSKIMPVMPKNEVVTTEDALEAFRDTIRAWAEKNNFISCVRTDIRYGIWFSFRNRANYRSRRDYLETDTDTRIWFSIGSGITMERIYSGVVQFNDIRIVLMNQWIQTPQNVLLDLLKRNENLRNVVTFNEDARQNQTGEIFSLPVELDLAALNEGDYEKAFSPLIAALNRLRKIEPDIREFLG